MSDLQNLIKIENQIADDTTTAIDISSGIYIFSVAGYENNNLIESSPKIKLEISLDGGINYFILEEVDYMTYEKDYFSNNIFIRSNAKIRIKSSLYDPLESGTEGLNIRVDTDVISGHHINTYI